MAYFGNGDRPSHPYVFGPFYVGHGVDTTLAGTTTLLTKRTHRSSRKPSITYLIEGSHLTHCYVCENVLAPSFAKLVRVIFDLRCRTDSESNAVCEAKAPSGHHEYRF